MVAVSVAADGRYVACPWALKRLLNAMLAPTAAQEVRYSVRPTSTKPNHPMLEIWVDGEVRWLVHRKVHSFGSEPPDPKRWRDPATGMWVILRHADTYFCDECPANKRDAITTAGPKPFCA